MSHPDDTIQDATSEKRRRDSPRSKPAVGFAPGWPLPEDMNGKAANDDLTDAVLGWPLQKRAK